MHSELRTTCKRKAEDLNMLAARENRSLTAAESELFDNLVARIEQLDEGEKREQAAAKNRLELGLVPGSARARFTTSGPTTYTDPHLNPGGPSFFKDLIYAQRGVADAADRLRTNNAERGMESRALGNTGAVGGAGGEMAPPDWIVQSYIELARPARVFANLVHREPLPEGVSSVNLPKVATGTTTGVQATQNSNLSQTDMTTTSVSSGITVIGGKQIVSQQLLDQSGIPFDRVITGDLTADWAKQLDTQSLSGTGLSGQLRGYLTPSSTNAQTWTQAAPTAALFYSQLAKLQGAINASRYVSPDVVLMHPRRWAWFASFTDTTGRPLVVPSAGGFNSMANPGAAVAAGHVGSVLGMEVYTDANLPINLGAATNQDVVLMCVSDDIWLWESEPKAEAFTQPYADSLAVLFRLYNYSAQIPDRYLASLGQLSGTGLTTPVFAG
jgi:HK97 family phage major capsid protein